MKNIISTFLILSLCLLMNQNARAQSEPLKIGGYYKNLTISSKSSSTAESLYASTNRLRLELKKIIDPWQFQLTVDNEAIISDINNGSDFAFTRSTNQRFVSSLDGDEVSVDNDHLYLKHSIYRAYLKYYSPTFQMVLGKQSVDWGKMRYYSPLDIFNTVGPTTLEYDERIGIDALNFNFTSEETAAGLNLVFVPSHDSSKFRMGAKYSNTIGTYDISIVAASIREDFIMGFAFDGYLKEAGLRGELTQTFQDDGRVFPRVSVGLDYSFDDKSYVLLEHFYNGGADSDLKDLFLTDYIISRKIRSLQKNLTSFWYNYKITPLLEFNSYFIYDWEGKSVVLSPELKYNLSENTQILGGAQFYLGGDNTEFGFAEDLYYVEFKWFF